MQGFRALVLILLCASSAFAAGDEQSVADVQLDLHESPLWPGVSRITADIPIKVLAEGNQIVGVQLGADGGSRFYYTPKTGWPYYISLDATAVPISLLDQNIIKVTAHFLGVLSRTLFTVDATGLDPVKGGQIKIQYIRGIFANNYLLLDIVPKNGGFIAMASDSFEQQPTSPTDAIWVGVTSAGLGIESPIVIARHPELKYPEFDPVPLTDSPEARTAVGAKIISGFQKTPVSLTFAKFELTLEKH